MIEKTFRIEVFEPVDFFGANNSTFELIRSFFPKLKIVARGDFLKVFGEEDELNFFEEKFALMMAVFDRNGKLDKESVEKIMVSDSKNFTKELNKPDDVLVAGRNGILVKAKKPGQRKMVEAIAENDLMFAIGPAGTGKTYTAVALAVRALKNKEIRRIVLTRPAVEAGESLGFLPGDLREKLDPYLQPLYDALRDMIPQQKLAAYFEDGTLEVAPLAFMRGRTLDNAFVILDEAQNATENQLKMFLTRMGKSAKFIVTGDITQIDLPRNQRSGLIQAGRILKDIPGIKFIYLDQKDIIRHKLVTRIVRAWESETKD